MSEKQNLPASRKPRSRHRARNILIAVPVILLILIAGIFVLPGSWLRAVINDKGSSKLGREFAIDGPLTIRWHRDGIHIRAEKLRLANAPGEPEPNMVQIGSIDATLNPWKLFEFQLNLPRLKFDSLQIVLDKKDADHKNWDMPALSQGKAVTHAALPQNRHQFPVIGLLEIANSKLEYRDGVKKLDLKLDISTVSGSTGTGTDDQRGLTIDGGGTLQNKTFALKATGGSIGMLRDSSKDYPLDLHLTMGATHIDVNGKFQDPVKMAGINTMLHLQGDNLADLFYLTSIPLPPSPAYEINGNLIKKEKVWSYNNFKGHVGSSDLEGNLDFDASGKRGVVTAKLVSNRLAMIDLAGFTGAKPTAKQAVTEKQKADAARQAANPRLIPDVPLKLDRLRATDMDVSLAAKSFQTQKLPLENMDIRFNLKDGLLRIDPLKFGISDGELDGFLVLDGRTDEPQVHADIALKKLSLKGFFKNTRFEAVSEGHFGGHIDVAGHGHSLAEVLADANGRITMAIEGGKMSKFLVKVAGLDIGRATPLFVTQDETTTIRCGIGDFGLKNGLLKSDILVFDTTTNNIDGDATVNLKDEAIDAEIESHQKTGSPLSARTPITISGHLKKPSIGIDPKEEAARVGSAALLGVLLTPVAAILPFIDLGLGKDSNCHGLLDEATTHETQAESKTKQAVPPPSATKVVAPAAQAPKQ